ncbi:hypothetical protein Ctob_012767 [Chrysochromulina tobinii]|uniref:Uncharacterized protein n=1 Tax=Chrysochromulina tobinii TaxID=1460289 RepID=A0A0M0K0T1_9EUKA|nr:hypothetical protein Ctob_012767 [Chrysochromulina tobinii]|eukprot:KOO32424.1 hypothetical protein Ctob_012767 [Chrysochromulina sp. CCMP291]
MPPARERPGCPCVPVPPLAAVAREWPGCPCVLASPLAAVALEWPAGLRLPSVGDWRPGLTRAMKLNRPPEPNWPAAAKTLAKPEDGLLKTATNSSKSSTPFPSKSASLSSACAFCPRIFISLRIDSSSPTSIAPDLS